MSVVFCSSMSRTISPLARSCEVTACLSSASSSPRVGTPARSTALKANVAMGLADGHPSGPASRRAVAHRGHVARHSEQALELLGGRRAALGELLGDRAAANEVDHRG